ncbi:MAG: hypothetical protein SWY16_06005 [Cyanobacteriota bacterium]|nr:hypothetical protein [Cyanobacteriota bacterium]
MSNSLVRAFFVGRVLAESIGESFEKVLTNGLSEVGKFDAEQREQLRQFAEEVMVRAKQTEETAMQGRSTISVDFSSSPDLDLQATIDDLRAEIAQLRTELQRYRSRAA